MNIEILSKLKEVQKIRGDLNAFANHDEFLPWSDIIPPLLEFDESLHKEFIFWANHVKSAYRMGRDHHDALGECIGVVNKAIAKLETQPKIEKKNEVISNEIESTEKVTLYWLYRHVPLPIWGFCIGIIFTSFSLGIAFSETELYNSLKSIKNEELAAQAIENKPPTVLKLVQEGDSGVLGKGAHKIYYPRAFKSAPTLKVWHIKSNGEFGENYIDLRPYKRLKEERDGFTIDVPEGYAVGYRAVGLIART